MLEHQHQRFLVCLPAVDERLRAECKLLQALGALCCRACGSSLARSADAVQMSEEGISACYVNSHSFVHDIVTLSQVRGGGADGAVQACPDGCLPGRNCHPACLAGATVVDVFCCGS